MTRLTNERVTGLSHATEPCWYAATPDGYAFEWGDGAPHYQSEEDAKAGIDGILKHYDDDDSKRPDLVVRRETEPCWHLACAECGYQFDADEWITHFADRAAAEQSAHDCDWRVEDGRWLCTECRIRPAESDGGASNA